MIERTNSIPLYLQLKDKIKREIRTGILRPGDKLPSESQLQKQYGMSRVTVRNAMEALTVEGYIIKVQGKGSFVAQSDMLRLPIGVTSYTEDAKIQGVSLTSKVIKAEIEDIASDTDREFFGEDKSGKVVVIKRLRCANGVPITIEENHFSMDLVKLLDEDLEGSLYELLMSKYHIVPANKGRRSIKISFATEEVAHLLDLGVGTPVIDSEMGVFGTSGEPIHTVRDIVRGDNDRFMRWYV
ncbi:MAG: GntR family transcriptional regulator [Eubacteriales bacterium]|nr:GntR family transcriptional regulator [Eubacteriales bacterium]